MKYVCNVCNTSTNEATAKTWSKEDFVMRDKAGERFFMTLYLCPRCLPFIKKQHGPPRAWLETRLPPELVRSL